MYIICRLQYITAGSISLVGQQKGRLSYLDVNALSGMFLQILQDM